MRRVTVPLPARSYDVLVGPGAIDQLDELVPDRVQRVAVVTQPGIPDSFRELAARLPGMKTRSSVQILPVAPGAKGHLPVHRR